MTQRSETESATETPEAFTDPTGQILRRRTFLGGIATAGAAPAMQAGSNQTNGTQAGGNQTEGGGGIKTHFKLGGRIQGWQGQSPSKIAGTTNPTLNLQGGSRYRVTWQNVDGVQHNFTILDTQGNEMISTDTMSNQGKTLSLTFTATEKMAQYVCSIHTNQMRGTIQINGGDQTGNNQTEGTHPGDQTEGGGAIDTQFELGAVVEGWQGRLPARIDGTENPTLNLQAGNRYRVTWQNADGVPHNFAIRDAEGNDIIGTKITSKQGKRLSLTFTASEEMDQYICVIHPTTMKGDIQIGGGGVENVFTDPAQIVGGMAAVIVGSVVGFWYVLSKYFEESREPESPQ